MTYSNLSDGRGTLILEIIRIHITWYGKGILGLENLPMVESGLKWLEYLVESSTNCENLGRKGVFEKIAFYCFPMVLAFTFSGGLVPISLERSLYVKS